MNYDLDTKDVTEPLTHIAACLRHEADNPGAMYVNDEWGYPSCIGTVLIYKQFPWRPMMPPSNGPRSYCLNLTSARRGGLEGNEMNATHAVVHRLSRSGQYRYLRLFDEAGENVTKAYARPGAKWVESCAALRVHTCMVLPLLFNLENLTILE